MGDLGKWAYRFADFLQESGQQLWQILPLVPRVRATLLTRHIPAEPEILYLSVFNPSVTRVCFQPRICRALRRFPESTVDFDAVIPFKIGLIKKAAANFFKRDWNPLRQEFSDFCSRMKPWLDNFAEFAALKEANGGLAWTEWKDKTGAKTAGDIGSAIHSV